MPTTGGVRGKPKAREESHENDDRERGNWPPARPDDDDALPQRLGLERRARAPPAAAPAIPASAGSPGSCRRRTGHSRRAAASRPSSGCRAYRSSRRSRGRSRSRRLGLHPEPARQRDNGPARGRTRAGRSPAGTQRCQQETGALDQAAFSLHRSRRRCRAPRASTSSTSSMESGARRIVLERFARPLRRFRGSRSGRRGRPRPRSRWRR